MVKRYGPGVAEPPEDQDTPLELPTDEMRAMVEQATTRILHHLDTLQDHPVENTAGGADVAAGLVEPLPTSPTPFDELLAVLFDEAIDPSFTTPSPGFMAYIPGGGIFPSAVADLIADAVNRFTPIPAAAPALNQLEANVVAWFCDMVGYPEDAGGLLTTGGSMANLIALVTARHRRLGEAFLDGVLYTSDQTHNSVLKAARFAGLPAGNVRSIPTGPRRRIDVDALEAHIKEDLDAGKRPFFLNANAGTTNTGAIDDLEALADAADRYGLWLHADAAYGGFFALTDEGRRRLAGLARSDSITLDPHKGLFLPYGTGSLLVRRPEDLAATHTVEADYLPDTAGSRTDYSRLSPELTRDFRGLRVWLPLKLFGIEPFRRALSEKMALAQMAADRLRELDDITVLGAPELSTLAFRAEPAGLGGDELDDLNRAWIEAVNERGRAMLSGTVLDGRFTLRISILVFRTHRVHVEACLEDLEQTIDELLQGSTAPG